MLTLHRTLPQTAFSVKGNSCVTEHSNKIVIAAVQDRHCCYETQVDAVWQTVQQKPLSWFFPSPSTRTQVQAQVNHCHSELPCWAGAAAHLPPQHFLPFLPTFRVL